MPRYLVERTFAEVPGLRADAEACDRIVRANAHDAVTWLTSYVALGGRRTWCVYEAPSPEALRCAAAHAGLPVSRIVEVRELSPYFHRWTGDPR